MIKINLGISLVVGSSALPASYAAILHNNAQHSLYFKGITIFHYYMTPFLKQMEAPFLRKKGGPISYEKMGAPCFEKRWNHMIPEKPNVNCINIYDGYEE